MNKIEDAWIEYYKYLSGGKNIIKNKEKFLNSNNDSKDNFKDKI